MVPGSIEWNNKQISVDEAWLEKGTKGGYYLCFVVKGLDMASDRFMNGFFIVGDSEGSVKQLPGASLNVQYLDSPDLTAVRLSLIKGFEEKRLKNIRFIPTK
jgi:hypothetical protein